MADITVPASPGLQQQQPRDFWAEVLGDVAGGVGVFGLLGLLIWANGGPWVAFAVGLTGGGLLGLGIGGPIASHTRQEERRKILKLQRYELFLREKTLRMDLNKDGVIGDPDEEPIDLSRADFEYFVRETWGAIGTTFHGGWEGKPLPSGRTMTQEAWKRAQDRLTWSRAAHRSGEHQTLTLDVDLREALKRHGYAPVVRNG